MVVNDVLFTQQQDTHLGYIISSKALIGKFIFLEQLRPSWILWEYLEIGKELYNQVRDTV